MTKKDELLQDLAREAGFAVPDKSNARSKGLCVKCGLPAVPRIHSEAGLREYRISGLCEECFDEITAEE